MRTLLLLGVAAAAGALAAVLTGARAELPVQPERHYGDPAAPPHSDADADAVGVEEERGA